MEKKLENKLKKRFIVTLPKELPRNLNVPGYEDIEKIAGTFARSSQSAVSRYLHRVHPEKAKLIVDILNKRMGGAEKYAFVVPEVKAEIGEFNLQEKLEMTEYALAYDLANFYHSTPFKQLRKAKEVLEEFERIR